MAKPDEVKLFLSSLEKSIRRGDVNIATKTAVLLCSMSKGVIMPFLYQIFFKYINIGSPDILEKLYNVYPKKDTDVKDSVIIEIVSDMAKTSKTYATLSVWTYIQLKVIAIPKGKTYNEYCSFLFKQHIKLPYMVFASRFGFINRKDFFLFLKNVIGEDYKNLIDIVEKIGKDLDPDGYSIVFCTLLSLQPRITKRYSTKVKPTIINGIPDYAIDGKSVYGKSAIAVLTGQFSADEAMILKYNEWIEGYLNPVVYFNFPFESVSLVDNISVEDRGTYSKYKNILHNLRVYVMKKFYKGKKIIE